MYQLAVCWSWIFLFNADILSFAGIESKISYLEDLGVNAFWVNSFYKSGENSYDYNDVVDHKKVDESVGTMADFDSLRKMTKKKGKYFLSLSTKFQTYSHTLL